MLKITKNQRNPPVGYNSHTPTACVLTGVRGLHHSSVLEHVARYLRTQQKYCSSDSVESRTWIKPILFWINAMCTFTLH